MEAIPRRVSFFGKATTLEIRFSRISFAFSPQVFKVYYRFLTDYAAVDRIINHPKLTFVAERPPPPDIFSQELLMAAETSAEYPL